MDLDDTTPAQRFLQAWPDLTACLLISFTVVQAFT
jgi:hypothetical protein